MAEAFRELGYEVTEVTGNAATRRQAIAKVRAELGRGRTFDFAYSETHTMPTALTEPHHLPLSPRLDSGLFATLNRTKIPIGLFYRDIHWRFGPSLSYDSPIKRVVTTAFHRLDWRVYVARVDHLFLPSLSMASALLTRWPPERMSALPPGGDPVEAEHAAKPSGSGLRLLYVGGVRPPLYDLEPLFAALTSSPTSTLTLCCREEEWKSVRSQYAVPANVDVVHRAGHGLRELYSNADAVAILWRVHPYLEFAMPVKLMEAIAFGLPVITLPGTELARFVERESLGWVPDSTESAARLLNHLNQHPAELASAKGRVVDAQPRHTWLARARQVTDTLLAKPNVIRTRASGNPITTGP